MLNFINNKFRKIITLKTVVLSNLVYDISCGCFIKNNREIRGNAEVKDKKDTGYCDGICGKGNSDQSNINTDTSTDYDSNISDNDGDNGGGDSNNNNENLIKNKKENLLRILEEIKNDNEYLSDKIAEQDINNLRIKIENSNNNDISNIKNELNDLRNTLNSKLDKIKKDYINTVVDINNSIEILENYDNNKFKLQKYTLETDEVNNKKFNEIKDLNDVLDEIKKNYNKSINEIVSKLKSEFEILKKQETDDNKLDVKDEDFNNLTDVSEIINIDKKLFIYENIINNNKEEIIKKINPINDKLENHKDLINELLKNDFEKETNLDNKNIEDLCNLYEKLLEIYNKLLIKFNKYKKIQQNKYIELINVYNTFKNIFNFNFGVTINFNEYDLDNYKDFDKQINEFENNFKYNISNIKKDYENRIIKLKDVYKEKGVKKEININIEINNNDELREKCDKLNKINDEIQKKEKTLKYIVTKPLSKKEMEDIFYKVSEMKKYINFNPVFTYNSGEYGYNPNIIHTENNNIEDDISILLNRLGDIRLNYNISFKINGNNVLDYGGVRRQKFEEMTNYILNNKKINSSFYDIDNQISEIGNCNLFNQIEGYSVGSEKDNYNNFGLICGSSNDEHESYYKLLAYLCANSLRNGSTLKINFNPIIYKIMLNFDFKCNLDDKKIVCDNLKKFITYDDLKYFSTATYDFLKTNFYDEAFFDDFDGAYENMINHFSYQIEGIKTFYKNLLIYLKYNDFFEEFEKDEFWNLKLFIEGKNKITSDDILSIINTDEIMKTIKNGDDNLIINVHNANIIINCFKEILIEFNEEQIKDFLRWISGSTSIPSGIYFQFKKTVDYQNKSLIFCHSCGLYFDLSLENLSNHINNGKNFDFINKELTKDQEKKVKETLQAWLIGSFKGTDFNQV